MVPLESRVQGLCHQTTLFPQVQFTRIWAFPNILLYSTLDHYHKLRFEIDLMSATCICMICSAGNSPTFLCKFLCRCTPLVGSLHTFMMQCLRLSHDCHAASWVESSYHCLGMPNKEFLALQICHT